MKAVILLILIIGTLTVDVEQIIDQVKNKVGETVYGQQLGELLELHLSGGSAIDDVLAMLGKVLEQIEADQNSDDMLNAKDQAQTKDIQSQLEANVESLNKESSITNQNVLDLTQDIASLTSTIASLKNQIQTLADREETIRQSRAEEAASYQKRQAKNNQLLTSINELTKNIYAAADNDNVLLQEGQSEQQKLKDEQLIGTDNPLALLVQMTKQLDRQATGKMITKLEDVKARIQEAIAEDENSDRVAQSSFQAVIQEVSSVRENLSNDYNEAIRLKKFKENDLATQIRTQGDIATDLERTQTLLVQTRVSGENQNGAYMGRKESRTAELSSLRNAYDMLSNYSERKKAQSK